MIYFIRFNTYALFLIFFSSFFRNDSYSQDIEFNRPQITFLFSTPSNDPNIINYINYISNSKIKSNLFDIITGSGANVIQNKSSLEVRDFLRYNDFYDNLLPFFNQVEFNQVANPKVDFSINEVKNNNKLLLLNSVNDIFNFMFNASEDKKLKLDRFFIRSVLNAKQSDIALSENVTRGKDIITDNILKLTNQIYIAIIEYNHWKVDANNYTTLKSKVLLYRIDFSKFLNINNTQFWGNFNNPVQNDLISEKDFDIHFVASTSLKSFTKNLGNTEGQFNSLFYQDLEQFFNNLN
jgi:hypothetical protein